VESGSQAQGRVQTLGDLRDLLTGRRVFAAFIDLLVAFVVGMFVSELVLAGWMDELYIEERTNPFMRAWIDATVLFAGLPYYAVCDILWGRTIGKALLGIKVVSLSGNMNRWRMLVRNLVRITWAIPYLGFLFLLADVGLIGLTEKHQRLGDIAAGTTVIRSRVGVADKEVQT